MRNTSLFPVLLKSLWWMHYGSQINTGDANDEGSAARSTRLISQPRSEEDKLKDGEGWSQGQGHQPPACPISFQLSHLRDAVGQTKRHSLCLLILPLAGRSSLPYAAVASWAGCLPACREAMGSPEEWNSHSRQIRPQSLNPLAGAGQSICLGRSPLASLQRTLPDSGQPLQPPSQDN